MAPEEFHPERGQGALETGPDRTTDMTMANDIRTQEQSFGERIAGFVKGFQENRQRRKVFRETLSELKALSSRDLADLGINRSMITRVAAEAAYGEAA